MTLDVSLAAFPRVASDREVVDKGIDPDVDGVIGVFGNRNAPGETGGWARDGQVGEVGGLRDVDGREGGEEGCRPRRGLEGCGMSSRKVSFVETESPGLYSRLGEEESHSMRRSRKEERRNL